MRKWSGILLMLCAILWAGSAWAGRLEAVLPSGEILYSGEKWFVDYSLSKGATVYFQVFSDEAMTQRVYSKARTHSKAGAQRLIWDGVSKKKLLPQGLYYARFFEKGQEEAAVAFPLTLAGDKPAQPAQPGPLLPENESVLWQTLTAPLAVIDLEESEHQAVWAGPSKDSRSLGTLHGQNQGVEVLASLGDYVRVGAWRHEDGAWVEGYIPAERMKWVTPNSQWGLVVNKQTQVMTVYHRGEAVKTFQVSTGLMKEKKLDQETPAGAFLITSRYRSFARDGCQFRYGLRFDGENLISRVCQHEKHQALLGEKATDGMIVLDEADALWLWEYIPYHTKLLIWDDPQERLARQIDLDPKAAAQPRPALTPAQRQGMEQVILTVAGDCVLGSEEKTRASPASFDSVVAEKGMDWPFSGLEELFGADDLTLVNLECVLKDSASGKTPDKWYNFRGPTGFAEILSLGSVETVNIANNHFIDYGTRGRTSTQKTLEEAGISYSGYESLYVAEVKGVKIGFGGIRETRYHQDRSVMQKDIEALRAKGCDVVVYSCHFGAEYERTHNDAQTQMARQAIDWGADVVVGHHPHVAQGVEAYHGGVILYSLGNCVFGGNLELTEFDGLAARLSFWFKQGVYQGAEVTLVPILTTGSQPANDFRPVPAQGEDKARIMGKVQNDSELLLADILFFPTAP